MWEGAAGEEAGKEKGRATEGESEGRRSKWKVGRKRIEEETRKERK